MKAIWQGTLSFGLVNIPISLVSAVQAQSLGFTLLCGTCNSPISYKRWCNHCDAEVAWDNVVKGIKLKKGSYFILTKENVHKLKPITTEAIDIVQFVDPSLIDTIYLEKHYYILPKKTGEKAYFLFEKALSAANKVAVGVFVMRDKEHVCSIAPFKDGLLLTTLNYAYEIRDMQVVKEVGKVPKISSEELKLAVKLIEQRSKKRFDITQFKDRFAERLTALIKKGKSKKKVAVEKKPRALPKDKTLMAKLEASLKIPKVKGNGARVGAYK